MQKLIFGIVSLMLIGLGGFYAYSSGMFGTNGGEQIFCTMEAKLCPDGVTYVGRQGPKCEFAACPTASTTPESPVTLEVMLNNEVSALGVSITPLQVLEDSRCPIDVQCIQAGTVRVKAKIVSGLGESIMTFTLNSPITTEAEEVTLISVSPKPLSTHTISAAEYRFIFEIKKRSF
jgi:hypothetical protein